MKIPVIDGRKLKQAMEWIETAAELMEDNIQANEDKLNGLGEQLGELAGKPVDVYTFREYWGHSSLEDMAKAVLMPEPESCELTDEELRDMVCRFFSYLREDGDAACEYVIAFLEKNTGLTPMWDYFYDTDSVGLKVEASWDEETMLGAIADKIIADRNNPDGRIRPNVILL